MNKIKLLFLFILIAAACNQHHMEITILNKIKLDKIPSGSGITKFENTYYIIGDDSPYLFTLNEEFKTISKTLLVAKVDFSDQRINKAEKPDFEALEMIGKNEAVIFGSGSKSPQRNIFIRILLKDSIQIEKYDISDFYNKLRKLPLLNDSELNIEATAFHDNQIFLFNRKKNVIFRFEYRELLAYLKGEGDFPQLKVKQLSLPQINGIEAGFSGATTLKGEPKIIFTAAVENTNNAYDDGEILGSFIGMIDISSNQISDILTYCQIPSAEENLKVESVAIEEEISVGKTKVVLITDDDKGNSTLLESILLW